MSDEAPITPDQLAKAISLTLLGVWCNSDTLTEGQVIDIGYAMSEVVTDLLVCTTLKVVKGRSQENQEQMYRILTAAYSKDRQRLLDLLQTLCPKKPEVRVTRAR